MLETLVGVDVERSPEMLIALLGVWKAGGAYVPLILRTRRSSSRGWPARRGPENLADGTKSARRWCRCGRRGHYPGKFSLISPGAKISGQVTFNRGNNRSAFPRLMAFQSSSEKPAYWTSQSSVNS